MRFVPDIHKALWGEERWLLSSHPSAPSRIVGRKETLRDVYPGFPLLVKRIDAERRLSVQVHPNDLSARRVGGEAKTEMWCVLRSGPIFAGFKPGVSAADVERAVADGSVEDLLVRFDAKVGECYLIPGGLVHSIGEGTSVYEVQQSSDTTFRLYDWGRVGADGKLRPLHVREALAAMDVSLQTPVSSDGVSCPYFDFRKVPKGDIASSDAWQVLYTPSLDALELLAPGEGMTAPAPSFLTTVRF